MSDPVPVRKTTWAWVTGTFLGAGRMKPGPGTWGSTAAALIWLAAGQHFSPLQLTWLTLAGAAAALAIGVPAATIVEQESGREDPQHVVIDEVAGQWIALLHARVNLSHLLAGFLLFRLFDILKPWPARRLESLPGGWGIMLDDVAAGVYALLVMQALQHWIG